MVRARARDVFNGGDDFKYGQGSSRNPLQDNHLGNLEDLSVAGSTMETDFVENFEASLNVFSCLQYRHSPP